MPVDRQVYHVIAEKGKGWKVEKEGSEQALTRAGNKDDAISAGRRLAKSAGLGQLIIHRLDGTIEQEFTYGE